MIFAAVVLAFLAAYAAMFGFDKLKEVLGQIRKQQLKALKDAGESVPSLLLLHFWGKMGLNTILWEQGGGK